MFILAFTGWDLKFSMRFVSPTTYPRFIDTYGELPGWTVMLIASIYLVKHLVELPNLHRILSLLALIITGFAHIIILGVWPAVIYLIILVQVVLYFESKYIEIYKRPPYREFSYVTLLMGVLGPGIMGGLFKFLWGRTRYYHLEALSDFTQWYSINGPNGNYSFPSGHTLMATMVLPVMLLFSDFKTKVLPVLLLWICTVALGRVLLGAHYLTDVIFSIWLGITLFLILRQKFSKNVL